ncbi:hypothetical protein T08_1288 [Trichinella sp. T8]|nr:hypothetical protein T08_1288 [Trichinella sp. T8]
MAVSAIEAARISAQCRIGGIIDKVEIHSLCPFAVLICFVINRLRWRRATIYVQVETFLDTSCSSRTSIEAIKNVSLQIFTYMTHAYT